MKDLNELLDFLAYATSMALLITALSLIWLLGLNAFLSSAGLLP